MGHCGISFNAKRRVAALVPVKDSVGYHLFGYGALRVIRKTRWHNEHKGNITDFRLRSFKSDLITIGYIEGIDFDPECKVTVAVDTYGACVFADVDTESYKFHLQLDQDQRPCKSKH